MSHTQLIDAARILPFKAAVCVVCCGTGHQELTVWPVSQLCMQTASLITGPNFRSNVSFHLFWFFCFAMKIV